MIWKLKPIRSVFIGISAIFLTATALIAEPTEKTEGAIAGNEVIKGYTADSARNSRSEGTRLNSSHWW